jgi:hypothetical protein
MRHEDAKEWTQWNIMAGSLNEPVPDYEEHILMDKEDRTTLNELYGHLFGPDGRGGGVIDELKAGQSRTQKAVENLSETLSTTVREFMDSQRKSDDRMGKHEARFDVIEGKVDRNAKTIEAHISDHDKQEEKADDKRYHQRWALIKTIVTVLLTSGATIGLYFIFGIGG